MTTRSAVETLPPDGFVDLADTRGWGLRIKNFFGVMTSGNIANSQVMKKWTIIED